MVEREQYLAQLLSWKDEQVIKVVTGIRRCGKSTLLDLYQNKLRKLGINDEQIVALNFEDLANRELLDYLKLYDYLVAKLVKGKKTYIFLDEIQNVNQFEKMVDSLYIKPDVDLYITGSNAFLLSGELATLLSGRYVEIKMLPFSFKEYLQLMNGVANEQTFSQYLQHGGMPYVAKMSEQKQKINQYLEGIYNTVIIKDIEDRQNRCDLGKHKISDIALLKSIAKYLANVIGSPVSAKGIADYLTSNNRKVSVHTVSDYLDVLVESFMFYPAMRYDLQGKEELKSNPKYYAVDLGLRNYLVNKSTPDLGCCLENVVYLELLRRGYKVSIGKLATKEIDFIAEKNGKKEYFQVSLDLTDETTFNREITPLCSIKDNYPKTILTLDAYTVGNYNDIEVKNIIDWLLD